MTVTIVYYPALFLLAGLFIGLLLGYLFGTRRVLFAAPKKMDVDVHLKPIPVMETESIHDLRARALSMARTVALGARRVTGSMTRCEGHIGEATTSTGRCTEPHKDETLGSLRLAASESQHARASMANVEVGTLILPDMLDVEPATERRRRLSE